jgi:hypothetical protein
VTGPIGGRLDAGRGLLKRSKSPSVLAFGPSSSMLRGTVSAVAAEPITEVVVVEIVAGEEENEGLIAENVTGPIGKRMDAGGGLLKGSESPSVLAFGPSSSALRGTVSMVAAELTTEVVVVEIVGEEEDKGLLAETVTGPVGGRLDAGGGLLKRSKSPLVLAFGPSSSALRGTVSSVVAEVKATEVVVVAIVAGAVVEEEILADIVMLPGPGPEGRVVLAFFDMRSTEAPRRLV